jgi:hypothetical protein
MLRQESRRKHYSRKRSFLAIWLCMTLLLTSTVWADNRFKINPDKVAAAEVRMWKAYYSNNINVLRQELLKLLQSQFDLSLIEAIDVGKPLALAAMKFDRARSNYKLKVLPDLELAYSRLKKATGTIYDSKEAARAELDWWAARRTPEIDNPKEVGHRIARLYTVLFGGSRPEFERAGLLRAQAAHLRDKGGSRCDWDTVEQLLLESYQTLQDGL